MDRWTGKVAVVTGASSGIGAAIAMSLASAGMVVVGLARRVERVEALRDDLEDDASRNRLHAVKCDVSNEEDILEAFRWSIAGNDAGHTGNPEILRQVMDINVMGLVLCSREAFQSMKKRSVDGHVVHINSISGHTVPNFAKLNMYSASKFAVTALTETMRREFAAEGTKVKVTSISPGATGTDILPPAVKEVMPLLEAEDIAAAVLYAVGTPPHVQVHELTIKPIGEFF
ncbi:hypothetical protein quinque_004069 [Culex quinquefasciatus]